MIKKRIFGPEMDQMAFETRPFEGHYVNGRQVLPGRLARFVCGQTSTVIRRRVRPAREDHAIRFAASTAEVHTVPDVDRSSVPVFI